MLSCEGGHEWTALVTTHPWGCPRGRHAPVVDEVPAVLVKFNLIGQLRGLLVHNVLNPLKGGLKVRVRGLSHSQLVLHT